MSKIKTAAAAEIPPAKGQAPVPEQIEMNEEDKSKDAFFIQIAEIAEAMIGRHGKDFTMGTLLLTARFIAEGKPLIKRANGGGGNASLGKTT